MNWHCAVQKDSNNTWLMTYLWRLSTSPRKWHALSVKLWLHWVNVTRIWRGRVGSGLEGWLLQKNIRSCRCVGRCQFQRAARWTCHWPKLSPSAMVVVPLWWHIKGKSFCAAAAGREGWKYVRGITLKAFGSVEKEGEEVFQVLEQRIPCRSWQTACQNRQVPEGSYDPMGNLH